MLRSVCASTGLASLDGEDDDGEARAVACPQPGPEQRAAARERLTQTLDRIDALPANLRDAMRLRVLQDQPTGAVCAALSITEDNLFVRLHRARRQLSMA